MPDPSRVLRINLFGCPRIVQPDSSDVPAIGRKTSELLALLLLHRNPLHHREKLATTLWSESSPTRAARSFRTTLWRLRAALEPSGVARGTYLTVTNAHEVGFNWRSEYSVDVLDFQSALDRYSNAETKIVSLGDLEAVEAALRLYEGELLEGHFDDWIIYERERLRDQFIRGLGALMRAFMRDGQYHRAIECGCRVLAEDALRESVHRDLMACYVKAGRRADAIRLYDSLRKTLRNELGVAPADDTIELFLSIASPRPSANGESLPNRTRRLSETVDRLQASLDAMRAEQSRMGRTLESLKSLLASRRHHTD